MLAIQLPLLCPPPLLFNRFETSDGLVSASNGEEVFGVVVEPCCGNMHAVGVVPPSVWGHHSSLLVYKYCFFVCTIIGYPLRFFSSFSISQFVFFI